MLETISDLIHLEKGECGQLNMSRISFCRALVVIYKKHPIYLLVTSCLSAMVIGVWMVHLLFLLFKSQNHISKVVKSLENVLVQVFKCDVQNITFKPGKLRKKCSGTQKLCTGI